MAVKSYADKITTNFDKLSPKRQAEMAHIWNTHEAGVKWGRMEKQPLSLRKAILKGLAENLNT